MEVKGRITVRGTSYVADPLSGGLVDRQGVFRFYKFYKTRSDERAALSRRRNLNRENFIPTEGGSEGPKEGTEGGSENASTAKKARGHVCQINNRRDDCIVSLSLSVRCEGGRGRNEKWYSSTLSFRATKAASNPVALGQRRNVTD